MSPHRHDLSDRPPPRQPHAFRVVTYNIHSCLGVDWRASLERVTEVLASLEPDVVALQEVDVGRVRTGRVNQAEHIAAALGMRAVFQRAVRWPDGEYGIATLTRLDIEAVETRRLPLPRLPYLEQRVAVKVHLRRDEVELVLVNTHLGLLARERRVQVAYLQGWLGDVARRYATVLCGDLNASPRAPELRGLDASLTDAFGSHAFGSQAFAGNARGLTFPARFPLRRIDHIRVSRQIACEAVTIPRTALTRVASDHYPVVADLDVRESHRTDGTPAPPPGAAG